MKKVLLVSGHFEDAHDDIPIGGVQRHIKKVTDEMRSRGHEVSWCYPQDVKMDIAFFNPDIILAHDFFCFTEGLTIPQITVFHGWEGRCPPHPDVIARRQEVERLSNASVHVGHYIGKWYGQKPDRVIYGGVEPVNIVPNPNNNTFLYLGRLEPDNSPELFFQALAQLDFMYELHVCGDGSLRSKLEEFAVKNNINAVFHGFVNNPDKFIKASDIVFTSGYLSILESYINKRPVISVWQNELKRDYLNLMPSQPFNYNFAYEIAKRIIDIRTQGTGECIEVNYKFASSNTWSRVVDMYEEVAKCLK